MMDHSVRTARRARGALSLGLTALALAGVGPAPAHGASFFSSLTDNFQTQYNKLTKHTSKPGIHITGAEAQALKTYLTGGPTVWEKSPAPKFPAGLVITNAAGTLDTSKPVTQFLMWKRDQDPSLFDTRHPKIAPLFQAYDRAHSAAQVLASTVGQSSHASAFQIIAAPSSDTATTGTGTVTVSASSTNPAAQEITVQPQPVPEPGSVAVSLLLFAGSGLWWHRRRTAA